MESEIELIDDRAVRGKPIAGPNPSPKTSFFRTPIDSDGTLHGALWFVLAEIKLPSSGEGSNGKVRQQKIKIKARRDCPCLRHHKGNYQVQ